MRYAPLILAAIAAPLLAAALTASAQAGTPAPDAQAEYDRVVHERARKIVDTLNLNDPAQADRVTEIIARQYKDLSAIHDARDRANAQAQSDDEKAAIHERTQQQLRDLHAQYLQRLSAELTQPQVAQVKDGMTYNVANITYDGYLQMLPNLTDEQKAHIRALLIEAREIAMDAGSSKEKHGVFGKYKGKINNYLSDAGYDLKQASRDWAARRKAQQQQQGSAGE